MIPNKRSAKLGYVFLLLVITQSVFAMGLRSFVALPVEKQGGVIRLVYENNQSSSTDTLSSGIAYGLSGSKTLLFGLSYNVKPSVNKPLGDVSVLYRQIVKQNDTALGTNRLAILAGGILATDKSRDEALQLGLVHTYFYKKHEVDSDFLYQKGLGNRADTARYDVSWQYRLMPNVRPDWGVSNELNSVLEVNGRWTQGSNTTHQITVGLQWINQKLVVEGGVATDLNNQKATRYLLSTRFHF